MEGMADSHFKAHALQILGRGFRSIGRSASNGDTPLDGCIAANVESDVRPRKDRYDSAWGV